MNTLWLCGSKIIQQTHGPKQVGEEHYLHLQVGYTPTMGYMISLKCESQTYSYTDNSRYRDILGQIHELLHPGLICLLDLCWTSLTPAGGASESQWAQTRTTHLCETKPVSDQKPALTATQGQRWLWTYILSMSSFSSRAPGRSLLLPRTKTWRHTGGKHISSTLFSQFGSIHSVGFILYNQSNLLKLFVQI